MPLVCTELESRGIVALHSRETHSCVVFPVNGEDSNDTKTDYEHVFGAPEVFISDDELASDDYMEIVLRKVTHALGRYPSR